MLWWLIVLIISSLFVYFILYKPHQYWKIRNVPYCKPYPIIGNMEYLIKRNKTIVEAQIERYNSIGNNRYMGLYVFLQPKLMLKDIDLIKQLFIKDFDHFIDRTVFITEDIEPLLGRSLFFLNGQKWKDMRSTLSPAFTGSKMRTMFTLIAECGENLAIYYEKHADPNKPTAVEMKDIAGRYATDVIATCAFGIKCDSLEDRDNQFYTMGKKNSFSTILKGVKILGFLFSKKLMKFFNMKLFSEESDNYYRNLVRSMMERREKEGIIRPDMIHLLMEAKKGRLIHEESTKNSDAGFATVEESHVGKERRKKVDLVEDDLVAQVVLFFAAGFDTTSTALSFMAHELAVNEDVQRKLQEEIDETMENCNGKLTYESILKMKYLDMTVSETLRLWSPTIGVDRKCIKPYTIQPVNPGETPLTIEEGIGVFISFHGLHMDPNYWPEPHRFDPERFSDENKKNIVPFSYLPFGVGPRNCIGSRFALLETKVFFVYLLAKFDIVVIKETTIPLELEKGNFGMDAKNGFWVGLKLRTK